MSLQLTCFYSLSHQHLTYLSKRKSRYLYLKSAGFSETLSPPCMSALGSGLHVSCHFQVVFVSAEHSNNVVTSKWCWRVEPQTDTQISNHCPHCRLFYIYLLIHCKFPSWKARFSLYALFRLCSWRTRAHFLHNILHNILQAKRLR